MAKNKREKPDESAPEILKIPATLEDFKFRKLSQDWGLTFSIPPEKVDFIKPVMDEMGGFFILVLVRVRGSSEVEEYMNAGDELGKLSLEPGDFK